MVTASKILGDLLWNAFKDPKSNNILVSIKNTPLVRLNKIDKSYLAISLQN